MFGKKKYDHKIYPDEIFLDSRNVSGFDVSHFEGRMEKPIGKKTFIYLAIFIIFFGLFFVSRIFFLQIFVGKDGIEERYDKLLRGLPGIKLTEKDSQGNPVSESVQVDPKNGDKITLTIDAKIHSYLYSTMETVIKEKGFEGGSAV